MRIFCLSIVLLCALNVTGHQRQEPKTKYVVVPADKVLLVIASQPAAAIQLENTQLLMSDDSSGLAIKYRMRNIGTKPIAFVTLALWTSFGTGGTLENPERSAVGKNAMLMPGKTIDHDEITALPPPAIPQKNNEPIRPIEAIVVLIVQRITFADGTVYDDNATSRSLLKYFETVADALESQKNSATGSANRKLLLKRDH